MTSVASKARHSKAHFWNMLLIPLKQHFICCGLVPLISALVGGSLPPLLNSPSGELALGIVIPPLVTFIVMLAEQAWHNRRHRHSHECACAHASLTVRNFMKQALLAYAFYIAAFFLLPHGHDHGARLTAYLLK